MRTVFGTGLIIAALVLAGCNSVPPGKAPEGAITSNKPRQNFDVRSAVNYMTTSLSIHLLTDPLPDNQIAIDADEETGIYAAMVLDEISRVTGSTVKPLPASAVLQTRTSPKGWDFKLISGGRIIWQEHLDLDLDLCRPQKQNPISSQGRKK